MLMLNSDIHAFVGVEFRADPARCRRFYNPECVRFARSRHRCMAGIVQGARRRFFLRCSRGAYGAGGGAARPMAAYGGEGGKGEIFLLFRATIQARFGRRLRRPPLHP